MKGWKRSEDRYGPAWEGVRALPCHLCRLGYRGPGHEPGQGTLGQQGGPTAHHVGRLDSEGMIPVDGMAHDLFAGRGGRTAIEHFRRWLEEQEGLPWREAVKAIGLRYYAEAIPGGGTW